MWIFMSTAEIIQEKVNALPPEKQQEILRYVETVESGPAKTGEPYSALRTAASLNLDGPSDWSKRFHEYLYGENARDGK
jgi:hypothetical protein